MSALHNRWKLKQARQEAQRGDIARLQQELDRAGMKITSGGQSESHGGSHAQPGRSARYPAGTHATAVAATDAPPGPLTFSTDAACGYARPIIKRLARMPVHRPSGGTAARTQRRPTYLWWYSLCAVSGVVTGLLLCRVL